MLFIMPRKSRLRSSRGRVTHNKTPVKGLIVRFTRLALLNDFRTFDWASEYKYPTVVLDQMKEMLAKYENV